ncbi:MAG: hypothetical protein KBF73_13370 [Flavobacteriales bacterium]|nr:hypothetical protein [Flavobacteriales bacterium]
MKQIVSILFLAIVITGCSSKLYESNWKKLETKSSAFRFYHPDSKIRYNVENDDKNVYFSFDVMDQLTVQKILTTGLRLFIDGTGKNKQKDELQFPVYSDKVPISELQEYGDRYDQSMQLGQSTLDQMIPSDGYLKFDGETVQIFNRMEKKGTTVTLEFDSTRSLVYRAIIPLKAINADGNIISLGIETGGYEMPGSDQAISQADVTQASQGVTAGDRAMGRGNDDPYGVNTPSGSSAATMAMRNSNTYSKFADPIRFWVKVKLSDKSSSLP